MPQLYGEALLSAPRKEFHLAQQTTGGKSGWALGQDGRNPGCPMWTVPA